MTRKDQNAVSPVVGVMLMLVVTIIIAAVVSAFAGGLADESSKPIQASISAEYSQSEGMAITHMGGDVINTINTKILVAPTADFGTYTQLVWEVNTTAVTITKDGSPKSWFTPNAYSSGLARTFQPGETAFVSVDDLGEVQPMTYRGSAYTTDAESSYYGFNHANAIGQRFILSLVDSEGRTIAKTEVQIEP